MDKLIAAIGRIPILGPGLKSIAKALGFNCLLDWHRSGLLWIAFRDYERIRESESVGSDTSTDRPVRLTVEFTNACNLHCPACETGSGVLGRPKRVMLLDEFRSVLDQFDENLDQLVFYFMGVPFLNPG